MSTSQCAPEKVDKVPVDQPALYFIPEGNATSFHTVCYSGSVRAMRKPRLLMRVAGGKLNRFADRSNLVIDR